MTAEAPRSLRGIWTVAAFTALVSHQDELLVVALRGDLDLTAGAELRALVRSVGPRFGPDQVVFDCRELRFIDARGLGILIETAEAFGATSERPVTLRNVQRRVRDVLEITDTMGFFVLAGEHAVAESD